MPNEGKTGDVASDPTSPLDNLSIASILASISKHDDELLDSSRPIFISVPTVTNDPDLSSFLTKRLDDRKFISLRNKFMGHSLLDFGSKLTGRIDINSKRSRKASKRPRQGKYITQDEADSLPQPRKARPMSAPPYPNHT